MIFKENNLKASNGVKKQSKNKKNCDIINKEGTGWFYSDIVKDHFFHPRNLLLKDPKRGEFNAVGVEGSMACLTPSTLVRVNSDLKHISKIKKNDKVLSHDSSHHSVKKFFDTKYPAGSLVKITNYLGKIVATPDHLIYAKQIPIKSTFAHNFYKRKIPSSWVHAGDLKKGDISLYPLPREIKKIRHIGFLSKKSKWDFCSKKLPQKLIITPELLELFGYFIAEGSTSDKEVRFDFSDKEMILAKFVKNIIKKIFNIDSRIYIKPKNHRIYVIACNVHLSRNFRKLFGKSAKEKQIPNFLMFIEPKLQKSLLKGMWLGDGYFAKWRSQPRAGYSTISVKLFRQIIFLLLRQYIIPSALWEKAKKVNGIVHQRCYRIHVGDMRSLENLSDILGISFKSSKLKRSQINAWFEDNYLCLPIKKTQKTRFEGGQLYNLEVAHSHTYTTDAFLVHNCGDIMKMWLKIEPKTGRIEDVKWRTFGCASAIAATSMYSLMLAEKGGKTIKQALKIKPQDVIKRLGGLPNRKIHCSVLADLAFKKAIKNYYERQGI